MDTKKLAALAAAVRLGSFTRAAEELGYTDSFRSAGMTGGLFGDFFSRPFGMLEPFFNGAVSLHGKMDVFPDIL